MSKFLLLSTLLLSLLVVRDWAHGGVVPKTDDATANKESYELINYAQLRDTPHHIVKRKSKMGGRGFGFGKGKGSKSKSQNRDPYPKQPQPAQPGQNPAYPKQPAYNPNYPGGAGGAPPPYPGTNSRPGYPPAGGAPPPYPGTGAGGHYGQAPPPYPGTGHHNMPAYPPAYSGGGYGYGHPGYGGAAAGAGLGGLAGAGAGGFGGKGFGNSGGFGGMGKGGGGLGRTLGAAGFGAVAGTALGAYGGYKLGRMVGGLGRNGHYGYYDDYGKYIRCDPPRNIKVDPETNVTYIPLDQDYDKRCNYFDRRPPSYWGGYTNGGACNLGLSSPVNRLVGGVVNWTLFSSGWNALAQLSLAGDNVLVLALVAAVMMFR